MCVCWNIVCICAFRSQEDREARQKLRKAGQLIAHAPVIVPEPTPPQDDFQGIDE